MIFKCNSAGILYYNILGINILLKPRVVFNDDKKNKQYLNQDRIVIGGVGNLLIDIMFFPMEPFIYRHNKTSEEFLAGGLTLPSIGFWVYDKVNWFDKYKVLFDIEDTI